MYLLLIQPEGASVILHLTVPVLLVMPFSHIANKELEEIPSPVYVGANVTSLFSNSDSVGATVCMLTGFII